MTYGLLGLAAYDLGLVKHKVFVSYHHGADRPYYREFAEVFCDTYDLIEDNSVERAIDSDDVQYVSRKLREDFITGSSCTIVLVGARTWGRKFVDWEIKATLDKQHGLVGVQLPTSTIGLLGFSTPPDRLRDNIESGYALWLSWTDITAGPQSCRRLIEAANLREKWRINNSRERRLRNA